MILDTDGQRSCLVEKEQHTKKKPAWVCLPETSCSVFAQSEVEGVHAGFDRAAKLLGCLIRR